jgi:hypothetical protein
VHTGTNISHIFFADQIFILSAPISDLIVNLPGLNETVPFKQYAGYITVDQTSTRRLFYWYVFPTNPSLLKYCFSAFSGSLNHKETLPKIKLFYGLTVVQDAHLLQDYLLSMVPSDLTLTQKL